MEQHVLAMAFDLDDPMLLWREDLQADPRPLYEQLRRDAPVWRLPDQDTYLVSDPNLIRDAVVRPSEFSSNLVSVLHLGDDGSAVSFEIGALGDPTNVLATADPPEHTRQRKLLQPYFSPAVLAELEPTLGELVAGLLEPIVTRGGGDVVTELANPLTASTICRLAGIAPDHATFVMERVTATGPLMDGVADLAGMVSAGTAALELMDFSQAQLDAARSSTASDRYGLLAVFIDAIDAGTLDVDEARNLLVLLFNAGTETTSSLIANMCETLARNPELQQELREHPDRIPGTLEQQLHDDGPFQFHYRWTPRDTDLGGTQIPANSRVLLMWAAANLPSDNEIDASTAAHLAFGRGLHFCIGAPLARLEARVVIGELLRATSNVTLDPAHRPERARSIFLRRHTSLHIDTGPRGATGGS
jgi:cytochrome P450